MQVNSWFLYQWITRKSDNEGFTFIELLVIMVVIGILMTIAIPTYTYLWNKSKVYRCMDEIRILEKEIIAYQINYGSYPPDLATIKRDNLRDPWGNKYEYSPIPYADGITPPYSFGGDGLNMDFDLFSKGKDGSSTKTIGDDNTEDDVIRGNSGEYVGLGQNYP